VLTSLALVALAFLPAAPAHAQIEGLDRYPEAPSFSPLPFHTSPLTARSLGMGGAFLAVADDATALDLNPAGLAFLDSDEVTLQIAYRAWDLEVSDLNAQAALDTANLFHSPPLRADTTSTFDETVTTVPFAGYVHRMSGWSVGLYYREAMNIEGSDSFTLSDDGLADFYSTRNEVEQSLSHIGVSAGFEVGRRASLGLTLRNSTLDVSSVQSLSAEGLRDIEIAYDLIRLAEQAELGSSGFLPNAGDFTDLGYTATQRDGSDSALTWGLGLLWNPEGKISLALNYQDGGSFEIDERRAVFECLSFEGFAGAGGMPGGGPACDAASLSGPGGGLAWTRTPYFGQQVNWSERQIGALDITESKLEIDLPDTLGIGMAYTGNERLTLAVDVVQVAYGNLDRSRELLDDPNLSEGTRGLIEEIDDGIEIHVGIEYLLGRQEDPVALRFGIWSEPDHDGYAAVDSGTQHFSFGVGFAAGQHLSFDLGAHVSDLVSEAIVGLTYRP
jgi:long-subunit fatty acid transport protein